MRIGAAEPDSTFLTQGLALRTVLEKAGIAGSIEVVCLPAGGIDNANLLHAGEIDFGLMSANWVARARQGSPPFAQPIDLRMVAPMNAGPLYFIAHPNSDLACVSDLRGRRVSIGARTSGMAQHARSMFSALGWDENEVDCVYLDFAAGAEAVLLREADAQLQCPLPNKVMNRLTARSPVKVLPWTSDQLERLLAAFPIYRRTTMTPSMLRGLECNLAQPAVLNVLVTHARVDERMVHDVVCAILADVLGLEALNPLFVGLSDLFEPLHVWGPTALEFGEAPLHPGALAAYIQIGAPS